MLENKIKGVLDAQSGIIKPKLVEVGDKEFIEFFKDDDKWRIELTFAFINEILQNDYKVDNDKFISLLIKNLLLKHGININSHYKNCCITDTFGNSAAGFGNNAKINSIIQKNGCKLLFINGEAKSGKTFLVKQCCNYYNKPLAWTEGKIFWIDFNGGSMNFSKFLESLITGESFGNLHIILDNLECCGLDNAIRILQFFKNLVDKINDAGHYAQLIVLQDTSCPIESEQGEKYETINVSIKDTQDAFKKQNGDNQTDGVDIFYDKEHFLDNVSKLNTNHDAKKLLFKLTLLSCYELTVRVEPKNKAVETLMDNFDEIKLFYNGKIVFYPKYICEQILKVFEEKWEAPDLDFISAFNDSFENSI